MGFDFKSYFDCSLSKFLDEFFNCCFFVVFFVKILITSWKLHDSGATGMLLIYKILPFLRWLITGLSLLIFVSFTPLKAQTSEESFSNYESIISELNNSNTTKNLPVAHDPFAEIQIHAGVGFTTSLLSVDSLDQRYHVGFLNGFEAHIGIDLFSPRWMAEGAIRRFSQGELDKTVTALLHEFELKIIYQSVPHQSWHLLYGLGLAGRFLTLKSSLGQTDLNNQYSTPASLISLGIENLLTRELSLSAVMGYRTALISETVDRSSFDATLKLNAHF